MSDCSIALSAHSPTLSALSHAHSLISRIRNSQGLLVHRKFLLREMTYIHPTGQNESAILGDVISAPPSWVMSVPMLSVESYSEPKRDQWELLYADDLVIMADSLEECIA